ncbi:MAG: EscR/YscR/HrcR family type III secretion system export apparatus protein [Chlamydiae bacterium]|jgi:type III secretion protein R|nr:EscR/YscR/HrcR family type III secretion system export apparatus protein [Chlamydiota bacterium]
MIRRYFIFLFLGIALFGAFATTKAYCEDVSISQQYSPDDKVTQPPLVQKVALLAAMSILPFAIMLLTSFMKMVVVLSLLRQALGVQNSPPNPVINGIALLMAIYVMFPTCMAMYSESEDYIKNNAPSASESTFSPESVNYLVGIIDHGKEPMRKFLIKNSIQKHRNYFFQLAKQKFPAPFRNELKATDFIIVIPAYLTSQVKGAFEIGVLLYLPFFVIDLVVSNILLAMGMMMLSPLTIALPLKLLLLVMVDGWTLLIQGIVLTYR